MGTRLGAAIRSKIVASLPTPVAGDMTLGFKAADNKLYKKDSNGVETLIEGGSIPDRLATGSQVITDWNAATQSGWYNSQTTGTTNVPDAATHAAFPYWLGYVHVYDANWKKQVVWNLNTAAADTLTWERNQTSGTWGPWYKVARSAQDVSRVSGTVYNDTGWINVTWQSGWGNYGAPFQFVQYRKIGSTVYLRGLATRSSGTVNTAFYLPAGFRPVQVEIFAEEGGGGHSRVDVQADGAVVVQSATSYSYVSMGNISFSTGETVNNLAGGMGGLSLQAYETSGWWGPGGNVANNATATTSVYTATTSTSSRPSANMAEVHVFIPAACGTNQAITYTLQVSIGGGAYNNVGTAYQHNGGSPAINLDCDITAWMAIAPGQSVAARVVLANAGGGGVTYFGVANITINWFVSTAAANTPYDSGWLPVVGGNVGLASGWSNYAQGWQAARYRRIGNRVKMEGLLYYGGGSRFGAGGVVLTLPGGFRPAFQVPGLTYANVAGIGERATKWNIYPSGVVATSDPIDPGGYQWLDCEFSLD